MIKAVELAIKIGNRLITILYWPICRAYARHLGNKPADGLLRYLCSFQFWLTYKFWPNFIDPRRFSEKVWSRQLNVRDKKFTMISDKLQVRDYVMRKIGHKYLIPLLWNGDNPEEIPFDELPMKFVIKTNHGCAYNIIVQDKTKLDREQVKRQLKKWISGNFCDDKFLGIAWAYKNIKPTIIIESLLENNGNLPEDYKFFCFSGRMEFFKVDFDRFGDHSEKFFDKELNSLDLFEHGLKLYRGTVNLPENFAEMIRVAEFMAEGFDFIRVDLYSVGNNIYFGELTPYPGGVSAKFESEHFDYVFGEKWKVKG